MHTVINKTLYLTETDLEQESDVRILMETTELTDLLEACDRLLARDIHYLGFVTETAERVVVRLMDVITIVATRGLQIIDRETTEAGIFEVVYVETHNA